VERISPKNAIFKDGLRKLLLEELRKDDVQRISSNYFGGIRQFNDLEMPLGSITKKA
jgi:hypothetical protein